MLKALSSLGLFTALIVTTTASAQSKVDWAGEVKKMEAQRAKHQTSLKANGETSKSLEAGIENEKKVYNVALEAEKKKIKDEIEKKFAAALKEALAVVDKSFADALKKSTEREQTALGQAKKHVESDGKAISALDSRIANVKKFGPRYDAIIAMPVKAITDADKVCEEIEKFEKERGAVGAQTKKITTAPFSGLAPQWSKGLAAKRSEISKRSSSSTASRSMQSLMK